MSEVKTLDCFHCKWNTNVRNIGRNIEGMPEFHGQTTNLNIFNMFGKMRYTFNFVTKTHINSYNQLDSLNLINEVKQYCDQYFPKNIKYSILHNSSFNLKRYGGKEHIHILLTILPGNGGREFINKKYSSIQGLPEYLVYNNLMKHIRNNRNIRIQEIIKEIKK